MFLLSSSSFASCYTSTDRKLFFGAWFYLDNHLLVPLDTSLFFTTDPFQFLINVPIIVFIICIVLYIIWLKTVIAETFQIHFKWSATIDVQGVAYIYFAFLYVSSVSNTPSSSRLRFCVVPFGCIVNTETIPTVVLVWLDSFIVVAIGLRKAAPVLVQVTIAVIIFIMNSFVSMRARNLFKLSIWVSICAVSPGRKVQHWHGSRQCWFKFQQKSSCKG